MGIRKLDPIQICKDYAADKKFLVADTSKVARATLSAALQQLGARPANVFQTYTYEHAKEEITRINPNVIITDYDFGTHCGLDLLEIQRELRPDSMDRLFILVTGNTSQTAVARAAEEDVDTYILKPFTTDGLRQSLIKAILSKIQPSQYTSTIERGKAELMQGRLEEALRIFQEAQKLDPAPALACFYSGQTQLLRQVLNEAEGGYQKGLSYNSIHYKCLVGLYDLLMTLNRLDEAYNTVRKIAQYFPANPRRLTGVLHLAIKTGNYADVESYYDIFTKIDERNGDVIKYICAALVVAGRFYIQQGQIKKALEVLTKAAVSSSGRTNILREVIRACMAGNLAIPAQEFLKRFPTEARDSTDFLLSDLLVANMISPPALAVEKGLKLLAKDYHEPEIYELLIRRAHDANLQRVLRELVDKASSRWPEKKETFEAAAAAEPDPRDPRNTGALSELKTPEGQA